MTTISVIIPVYNGEKYIAQCIENLMLQTHKNLEIIVVDDGSTDGSAQVVEKYPAVRLIRQENQGAAAARNTGIEAATGEYIHFMDCDDFINFEFYERMLAAIEFAAADVACCSMVNEPFPWDSLVFADRFLLTMGEDKFEITGAKIHGYSVRWLTKRSLIEQHKLDFPAGLLIEDAFFSLAAVDKAGRIITVPDAIYYYKKREGSVMQTKEQKKKERRETGIKNSDSYRDRFLEEHNLKGIKGHDQTDFKYKILGMPMLSKTVYIDGRVKWYFCGIRVARKKPVRK